MPSDSLDVPSPSTSADASVEGEERESLVVSSEREGDMNAVRGGGNSHVLSPLQSLLGSARKAAAGRGGSSPSSAYAQLPVSEGADEDATNGDVFWEDDDDNINDPVSTVRRGVGAIINSNASVRTAGADKVVLTVNHEAGRSPQQRRTWKETCIIHQRTILSWISLLCAVISMSSIGPAFKYLEAEGIAPSLAVSWRCQCMSIFLVPLAWLEKCLSPPEAAVDWFGKKQDLPFSVFIHVVYAGLAWGGNVVLWVIALQYTSSVHASLITSTQPMILCIYYQIVGIHISKTEWLGMLLAIAGIVIASMSKALSGGEDSDHDENVIVHSNSVREEILGDALCLLSAVFEVFILINRNKVKPYVPLMMYTAFTTVVVVIVSTLYSLVAEGTTVVGLGNQSVLGWASDKWMGFMLPFGFLVGVVCITGFNYAVQYMDPLVFATAQLIDPITTGLISWAARVEGIPPLPTWIGGGVISVGVATLVYGESKRKEGQKAAGTDAIEGSVSGAVEGVEKEIELSNLDLEKR